MSLRDTTPTAEQVRDSILTADDLGEEIVDVPEWGQKILIRGMDGIERTKVQKLATSEDPKANTDILILVARHAETGVLLFTAADRDALAHKSGAAIETVVIAAIRLSGSDVKDAEDEVDADPTSDGA